MKTSEPFCAIGEDALVQALEAARRQVALAEEERSRLERQIAAAREEQRLLERLLALRRNGLSEVPGTGVVQPLANTPQQEGTAAEMLNVVIEELEAAGRPLHISELMRLVRDRNVTIPGSGTQANLISYLRRDPRVVRPTRGMYALAASGLQNMTAPRRKRRRRKHMRSERIQERNNP
jgi:hypothetical protein